MERTVLGAGKADSLKKKKEDTEISSWGKSPQDQGRFYEGNGPRPTPSSHAGEQKGADVWVN